ncbi:Lytic transglycosylase catalytic [Parvibaculum lavamentivorans DS-1]|uniref:Lytic transglycosylase catalytic n=1 Tax=Parvibaculum lavamentivorans (strain DS-1 / DSM 13023 / NCIMB 13966) TaxID=402881 RepID=A7HX35_PARL1|nr:Lytic transglycosylase catalytic [Parvibaculum lavamentivorans DS-1]
MLRGLSHRAVRCGSGDPEALHQEKPRADRELRIFRVLQVGYSSRLSYFPVLAALVAASFALCAEAGASTLPIPRPDAGDPPARLSVVSSAPTAAATPGNTLSRLGAAELAALRNALSEADRGNWSAASRHMAGVSDPAAIKLVTWTRLIADSSNATFAELVAFREQNHDWPRRHVLALRAETALLSYPMSADDVIAWFSANPPQTGEGRIRYGKTLVEAGREKEGAEWIRKAWIENDFSTRRQQEILKSFGKYLTADAQQSRLARLLWEQRTGDAQTTAALMGAEVRALADARIQLISGSSKAQAALSQVPPALRADPGLLYDQVRYERRRGNDHTALPLLLTAPTEPHKMVRPDSWWVERKILARKAMSDGLYAEAYKISAGSGLTEGVGFAEAEFMAGWLALQYLNKADTALAHFKKLGAGVSTPISKSRAEYWSGRAASAAGRKDEATAYYRAAAAYPTTFYGQLATAALGSTGGDGKLRLPNDPAHSADAKTRFAKRELVHVANILQDLDRQQQRWVFMLHLADIIDDPEELAALSEMALKSGDQKLSLRMAKATSLRNIVLPGYAYPTAAMPQWTHRGPPVEKALVYGLSRQESEFDPQALSPAGARGIMQLMPTTARMVAKQVGLPYSPAKLTDPVYNATLGAAHLGDLVENEFGGSYIMSIAAYNAGSSRVRQWVTQYGDPRSTAVDPIDWIESIPFSETRNYVQRVIENMEVYRSRLSGDVEPVRIDEDLRRHTGAPISTPAPTPRLTNVPLAPPSAAPAMTTPAANAPAPVAPPGSVRMAPVVEAEDGRASTTVR